MHAIERSCRSGGARDAAAGGNTTRTDGRNPVSTRPAEATAIPRREKRNVNEACMAPSHLGATCLSLWLKPLKVKGNCERSERETSERSEQVLDRRRSLSRARENERDDDEQGDERRTRSSTL